MNSEPNPVHSQFGLSIRKVDDCRWDLLALGEVMLRLDPGEDRIQRARHFRVWEGGGEYNVARGLRRCFGLRTAIATAFAENPVGRLIEDLIYQGGVDQSLVKWVDYDGVGRQVRNGLNFTERGFGVRAAVGCSDRGVVGIGGFGGAVGGLCIAGFTGLVLQTTHSYLPMFVIAGSAYLLALLVIHKLSPSLEPANLGA